MKFYYYTIAATFALVLLSGCNRSSFNVDEVDTQAMINYQPPPRPYPQAQERSYARSENLEESYTSGKSEAKTVEPPTYAEKSEFDGAD